MPFQPGKAKTGGRQAGTKNKVTTDIKTRIAALVDNQFEQAQKNLKKLEPKEHVTAYIKFLEYVLPKQREQKLDVAARLEAMTEEELNALIELILSKP